MEYFLENMMELVDFIKINREKLKDWYYDPYKDTLLFGDNNNGIGIFIENNEWAVNLILCGEIYFYNYKNDISLMKVIKLAMEQYNDLL